MSVAEIRVQHISFLCKKRNVAVRKLIFFLTTSLLGSGIYGQISIPGDFFNDIQKSDTSVLSFYTSVNDSETEENSFKLIDPYTKISYNSNYARSYNDGPVWTGSGLTWEGHFGISGKIGKLSYNFYPVLFYSLNSEFSLASRENTINPWNYQFTNKIDWVQRYGDQAFFQFHPGQSEIKFEASKFLVAISTQNYSWGPSRFNPIMMSRQAAGFPHARLGLKPTEIGVGLFELNVLYGLLSESDYYDIETDNDRRYFNSLSFAYRPSFLKEVTVGFNKALYKQTQFFEFQDVLSPLVIFDDGVVEGDTLSFNDTFDQLASITVEWHLKESNFRTYLEYAVNDFSGILSGQFFIEPNHSRGYTIGFEKIIKTKKDHELILQYEHTNLSRSSSYLYRPEPQFYAHDVNRQGYTNNGQIIGSGIGPGGNADNLAISLRKESTSLGALIQRIESNKDYFVINVQDKTKHDQEYTLNLFFEKRNERVTLSGTLAYSANFNRYFEGTQQNLFLSLGTRIHL